MGMVYDIGFTALSQKFHDLGASCTSSANNIGELARWIWWVVKCLSYKMATEGGKLEA